jgi:hypothetical protein
LDGVEREKLSQEEDYAKIANQMNNCQIIHVQYDKVHNYKAQETSEFHPLSIQYVNTEDSDHFFL